MEILVNRLIRKGYFKCRGKKFPSRFDKTADVAAFKQQTKLTKLITIFYIAQLLKCDGRYLFFLFGTLKVHFPKVGVAINFQYMWYHLNLILFNISKMLNKCIF